MKIKRAIKKIVALGIGATMLGATLGAASAALPNLANYPAPFVTNGVFNGYFVLGGGNTGDNLALIDVATHMYASGSGTETVTIAGDAHKIGTDGNILEFSEAIASVHSYLDDGDLNALATQELSTSKGNAKYDQYLRLNISGTAAATEVVFEEADDDDELTALYLKFTDNEVFAQYHMDFTTSLDSDVDANDDMEDIEDKDLTMLGKVYSVVTSDNSTNELVLMGGSVREVLEEGEEGTFTVGGVDYTVSLESVAAYSTVNKVKIMVDGDLSSALADGDTHKFDSGIEIGISDITYQSYAGGIHSCEFFLGADKLELKDATTIQVNDDSITGTLVTYTVTSPAGEWQLEDLKINMTAQDNYWVPVDGKLSENPNLDEPELLFTQNFDFEFKGLKEESTNDIKIRSVSSEDGYKLDFTNRKGIDISAPLFFDGTSKPDGTNEIAGHFGDNNEILHIAVANSTNPIVEDEWFILNTETDKTSTTYFVQYKGHEINTTDDPQMRFNIQDVETGKEVGLTAAAGVTATADLSIGGETFQFTVNNEGVRDSNITGITGGGYATLPNRVWTENGAYIDLTNYAGNALPARDTTGAGSLYDGANGTMTAGDLAINVVESDTDRMDDYTGGDLVWYNVTAGGSSGELDLTRNASSTITMIDSDADDQIEEGYSVYGAFVKEDAGDTSTSTSVYIEYPSTQREALVYITSGEVTSTSAMSGGDLVQVSIPLTATKKFDEVSDLSAQNIILIGGPCANPAAAAIMYPLGAPDNCAEDFTAGEAMIKFYENGDNFALLIAGYSEDDTRRAGKVLGNYANYDLEGSEVIVKGLTLTDMTVTKVA